MGGVRLVRTLGHLLQIVMENSVLYAQIPVQGPQDWSHQRKELLILKIYNTRKKRQS